MQLRMEVHHFSSRRIREVRFLGLVVIWRLDRWDGVRMQEGRAIRYMEQLRVMDRCRVRGLRITYSHKMMLLTT